MTAAITGTTLLGCLNAGVGTATATPETGGPSTQVVGGTPAPDSWGGFAARLEHKGSGGLMCSGSVVFPGVVLTGAHCVTPFPARATAERESAEARFGWLTAKPVVAKGESKPLQVNGKRMVLNPTDPAAYQVRIGIEASGGRVVGVRKIVTGDFHFATPGTGPQVNDDALVFLDSRAGIPVLPSMVPPVGAPVVAAGFGYTVAGSTLPERMQQVGGVVVAPSRCAQALIGTDEVCVDTTVATGAVCNGDSGGPLLVRQGTRVTVAGTTSRTTLTAEPCSPGTAVMVNLSAHPELYQVILADSMGQSPSVPQRG